MQLRAAAIQGRPFLGAAVRAKTQTRSACRRPAAVCTRAFMTKHDSAALQSAVLHFCEAVNNHDVQALTTLLASDVVYSDRVWCSCDLVGEQKVRKVHEELWQAYPDFTLHLDSVLARDDANTVAVHFTATGTNFGEWRGFPASGRRSTFSGVTLFEFDPDRNDRIRQIITYRQPSAEEYCFYLGHEEL